MQWKSLHNALIEGEIQRTQRQVRLLDRCGLPELAEQADNRITILLSKIPTADFKECLRTERSSNHCKGD
jgi:hypothetical protein